MVMNLQYFGGRGSSSGIGGGTVAFDIDMKGSRVSYVVRNGKVYNSESGDPIALSANQIMKNAKNLGYDVKTYNAKQAEKKEKQRAEDRKKTSEQLDILWFKAGPRPRKGWKGH